MKNELLPTIDLDQLTNVSGGTMLAQGEHAPWQNQQPPAQPSGQCYQPPWQGGSPGWSPLPPWWNPFGYRRPNNFRCGTGWRWR